MEFSRFCVSSTGGSGGKTLLSLGLSRAIARRGIVVAPFKKGPDYIDAAWLTAACDFPAINLDLFFQDDTGARELFSDTLVEASQKKPGKKIIGLVEGNRGLFDGLDERGSCSTAALARVIQAPIIICVDITRVTRTIAAILQGLVSFEKGLCFLGAVLNRAGSSRHETAVRRSIEYNTELRVLGSLPRLSSNPFPERHMGLAGASGSPPAEITARLDAIGELVEKNCDVEEIVSLAKPAPVWPDKEFDIPIYLKKKPRLGYVLDKALWFYYKPNLDALLERGVELVKLTFTDPEGWDDLQGLYLGGGFPEDYAADISESSRLSKIVEYGNAGMPIYAECGGLLILGKGLKREGKYFPMAGFFDFSAEFKSRPCGLGYVTGKIVKENPFFPVGQIFRGHEFHYTICEMGDLPMGLRLERGKGLKNMNGIAMDGLIQKNVWASYAHLFAPSMPCWARNFVNAVSRWN